MRTSALSIALLVVVAAPARASPPEGRLGVGIHHTGQALGDRDDGEDPVKLGGGGLHVRWRFAPLASVEVALDRLGTHGDEDVTRQAKAGSLSLALHAPNPHVDLYVLGGIGRRVDELQTDTGAGSMVSVETTRAQLHLGAGIEKRFRRLGVGAEVRLVGLRVRDDDDERTPRLPQPTPPLEAPRDEHGAQITVGLTWYFGPR